MYQQGAGEYFDALAIHTYGLIEPATSAPAAGRLNFRRAELLRDIMVKKRRRGETPSTSQRAAGNDHPRWTFAVRPSQRSAYTIAAFQYAEANWPWAKNLCIWALRYPADTNSYPDNYTLLSAEFVRKPIYFAIQDYARGWETSETPWLPPPSAN